MGADVFDVDRTADECRQRRIAGLFSWNEQPLVGQVGDAWSEFEAEQMHEAEHMIREARSLPYFGLTWPAASAHPPALNRCPSDDDVVPSPQFPAKGCRNCALTRSASAAE